MAKFQFGAVGVLTQATPWVVCNQLHRVSWTVVWGAAGSTAAVITLEGTDFCASDDDYANGVAGSPAAGDILNAIAIPTVYGTGLTAGAIAGKTGIDVTNPFRLMRLVWTQSAGGAVNQVTVYQTGYGR